MPTSINTILSDTIIRAGKTILWLLTPVIALLATGYWVNRIRLFELDSLMLSKLVEWSIVLIVVALVRRYSISCKGSGLSRLSRVHRLAAFLSGYFILVMAVFGGFALFFGTASEPQVELAVLTSFFSKPFFFALEIILLLLVLFVAPLKKVSKEKTTEKDTKSSAQPNTSEV
ncbi:hypothetical protein CWE09_07705 [Aliidiomarina minuta]|uniref:Uncharacterized protein n=1 Tax=Aliidiomarina minuta TaxID=880057 RepID=A0A432W915_9GAMM|nr:hypothetical protein [Aliidiomarina minuta]RUO26579.1 hypothetical protein CWE09_07705 [Aliidiomarina minuta]